MNENFPSTLGVGLSATFREVQLSIWNERKLEKSEKFVSFGIHTQLLSWLQEILQDCGYQFADVRFLVVDTGPAESFTGLRLSLALVKSWLMICPQICLYTTSSLQIVYDELFQRAPQYRARPVIVGFFGFQKRVYLQTFCENRALDFIQDLPLTELLSYFSRYENPVLTGNFLKQPLVSDLAYERFELTTPHIGYSFSWKLMNWRDLKPEYHRKTTAEEQYRL